MPDEGISSIKTKAEFQKTLVDIRKSTYEKIVKALYKGATECVSIEDCLKHYEAVGLACNFLGDLLTENMAAEWEKTWYNTLLEFRKVKFSSVGEYALSVRGFIKKVTLKYYDYAVVDSHQVTAAEGGQNGK